MGCCGPKCTTSFTIFFNILFWFSGCAMVALGVILLVHQTYKNMFTVLSSDTLPQEVLQYFGFGCVAFGGVILFVGFFGCCGALQDSKCMLGVYVFFLVLVFLVELLGAGLGAYFWWGFPFEDSLQVQSHLRQKHVNAYGQKGNETFTDAMDFVQYELSCCGIDNGSDYRRSAWFSTQPTYNKKHVPKSCCKVNKLIWRDEEEPWKDPRPENENLCQGQDPTDYRDNANYNGCWEELLKWYEQQQLCFTPCLGALALLQVIGITFSICLIRNLGESA